MRRVLAGAFLALLVASGACGEAKPATTTKLKVAALTRMTHSPFYIARDKGFFADEGLSVEFIEFRRGADSLPALANGNIEAIGGSISAALMNVIAETRRIKVVADKGRRERAGGCSESAWLVSPKTFAAGRLKRPRDLRGLKFGFNPSGVGGYQTDKLMAQDGLTYKDVKAVDLEDVLTGKALSSGGVDIATTSEPWITRFVQSGEAKIWRDREEVIPNLQTGVVVFGPRLLTKDPETGERFIRAYRKGVKEYLKGKTASNVRIIAKQTSLEPKLIRETCWPDFASDGRINWRSIDDIQRWYLRHKLVDRLLREDEFWTTDFLD